MKLCDGNVSVHPSLYKAQELLFYLEILADFSESWTWCLFTGFKPKMSLNPRSYLLLYRHFFSFWQALVGPLCSGTTADTGCAILEIHTRSEEKQVPNVSDLIYIWTLLRTF